MAAVDPRTPEAPNGLPRLLVAAPASNGPADLAAHRLLMPAPPRPRRGADRALIEEVERAGLLGRGGAGFPTATKLRAVASGRRTPVVVVNGAESEPASRKDLLLLTTRPHLVLDGALAAAAAVGANRIEIGLDTDEAARAIETALASRRGVERPGATVRIVRVPRRYLSGEERSLVRAIGGGPAIPALGPRPFERGVAGRPTLVQNVETLAHLAQIVAFGGDWFREVGADDEPSAHGRFLAIATAGDDATEGTVGAQQPLRAEARAELDPGNRGGHLTHQRVEAFAAQVDRIAGALRRRFDPAPARPDVRPRADRPGGEHRLEQTKAFDRRHRGCLDQVRADALERGGVGPSLDQHHPRPGAPQPDRRSATGEAGADDHRVEVLPSGDDAASAHCQTRLYRELTGRSVTLGWHRRRRDTRAAARSGSPTR